MPDAVKSLLTFDVFKHLDSSSELIKIEGDDLKALQDVLTMMLKDIDDVCKEHDIDYVLGGGNCLGALRHGGFIPWDDDADIDMAREGFEAFASAFLDRFGGKYSIQSPEHTEGYELGFARIRLSDTVLRCRDDFQVGSNGVYVDVFMLENAPSNGLLRAAHGIGSLALGFALSCRRFSAHKNEYLALVSGNRDAENVFKKKAAIGRVLGFATANRWCKIWDSWNSIYENAGSEYVVCPAGRKHYFGELWRRDDIFPARRVPYEDIELCVPKHAEQWLQSLYGDYMAIPPEEDRESHVVYEFDLGPYAAPGEIATGFDGGAD